jgi:octanoyl-[GcvH]:protein N-octanoyltransferase
MKDADFRILLFWYTWSMNPLDHFTSVLTLDHKVNLEDQFDADRQLIPLLNPDTLIIRAWPTHGVILGKLDTVLPGFGEGITYLHQKDWPILIRKAGGLGVVCDEGVLNLTFLLSKHHPVYGGLHDSYTLAVALIRTFLMDYKLTIDAKAIPQSYCPGDYDLSVNGRKFAGIAQFRTKDAVMVMATLAVSGDQKARCDVMKGFYDRANVLHNPAYPTIDASVMATLTQLTGQPISVEALWEHVNRVVNSRE